jgi:small subunit ribosomal protein S17e
MGRIKTKLMKRYTFELLEKHEDVLSDEFVQNKLLVEKFTDVKCKKLRNIIAGFVTKRIKNREVL